MTVKEANNVASNVEDSLYNVGVEIFKDGSFWGSCLASDIFPCDDNIVIEVYMTKCEPGSPYLYKMNHYSRKIPEMLCTSTFSKYLLE